MAVINVERRERDKREWELNTTINRVGLRNRPGPKPKFVHNKENGAYVRREVSGID